MRESEDGGGAADQILRGQGGRQGFLQTSDADHMCLAPNPMFTWYLARGGALTGYGMDALGSGRNDLLAEQKCNALIVQNQIT